MMLIVCLFRFASVLKTGTNEQFLHRYLKLHSGSIDEDTGESGGSLTNVSDILSSSMSFSF